MLAAIRRRSIETGIEERFPNVPVNFRASNKWTPGLPELMPKTLR